MDDLSQRSRCRRCSVKFAMTVCWVAWRVLVDSHAKLISRVPHVQKSSQWCWDDLIKWSVVVDGSYDTADIRTDNKRRWKKVGEDEGSPVLYGRERYGPANDMRVLPPNPPRTQLGPYLSGPVSELLSF